jgi:anti-repressor protein
VTAVAIFRAPTGQDVRVITIDGEPWFVAAGIASALDLGNVRSSVALLDEDEKGVHCMDTPGGLQNVTVVSEAGLYSLILRSRKAEAKAFKRWITHDVLPAIRRTGSYSVAQAPVELDELEMARRYVKAIEDKRAADARAAAAEAHAAELAPSAHAWNVLASARGDYSVREAAYALNRDPGISTGQNRLFAALRELGWLDRRDIPYASHSTHVTLRIYSFPDHVTGEERTAQQVRVTVAGLRLLHKRLGGTAPLQLTVPADVEVAA